MKGVIRLVVEVDYTQMLSDEKIEALSAFTGLNSAEDLMKHHMTQLGEKLSTVVKEMPFVAFDIEGSFMEDQLLLEEPKEEEEISEPEYQVPYFTGAMPVPVKAEEPSIDTKKLLADIDEDLTKVSLDYGIPQRIKMSSELYAKVTNGDVNPDQTFQYKGFDVFEEGMEEPYVIDYTTYAGNKTGSYSKYIPTEAK